MLSPRILSADCITQLGGRLWALLAVASGGCYTGEVETWVGVEVD